MIWPPRITRNPTAHDFNKLVDQCKRNEIVESVGVKVQERGSNGTKLRVAGESIAPTYYQFLFCRNGEQITVDIAAKQDPSTVEAA